MPISGVGADIVDARRVARLISRDEAIFRARILGPYERSEIPAAATESQRVLAYARSIAAKEAFLKALGSGLTPGMRWPDIEIVERHGSRARLQLSGAAAQALAGEQAAIHLAFSSVPSHVLAIVTLTHQESQVTSI